MTASESTPPRQPSLWWTCGIIIATAFVAGAASGYLDAVREDGASVPPTPLIFGLVSAAGAAVLAIYLTRFGRFWAHWSPRKRLYIASLLLAAGLGFAVSLGLQMANDGGAGFNTFGNGRIAFAPALAVSLLWTVGMAISIVLYQRNIDEHEKQAYLWAGLAGFYAVVFVTPVWWLMARAGQLPPVDAMVIFLLAVAANAVVYFWTKFR